MVKDIYMWNRQLLLGQPNINFMIDINQEKRFYTLKGCTYFEDNGKFVDHYHQRFLVAWMYS